MDVKRVFLSRYLNVEANQDASNYVIDKDGVIKKNDYVDVNMNATTDINNMKGVNMEDNGSLFIVHIHVEDNVLCRISVKMLEHCVHQMQSECELSMVGDVTYFPDLEGNKMKDFTFDSQSIYVRSSCTQLLWSNQMLKYVTKYGN